MSRITKLIKNPYVLAFFFGIACLHFVKVYSQKRLSAPPPWVIVGDWTLTNQDEQAFGSQDLKGKVVVACFFFTRCPTVCPQLMNSMKELQKRFRNPNQQAKFVSITTDPEFDTPQVLKEYQESQAINWNLLTGSKAAVSQVVEQQMKFSVGAEHHLAELILLDQNGDVRGKFATDSTGLASLEKAAKFLIDNTGK